ncbi:putative 4-hydroxy-4-methyl-2-oxoglutarate aldolase [Vibrio sp. RC27]
MKDITPDICDKFESQVTMLDVPLHNFGQKSTFWGEVVTVRCYHDTSVVREVLSQNGKGKVLVVDGNGSCQKALFGVQMAIMAIENEWEGIVIYGAVRDAAQLSEMYLGIKALATCPFKTHRHDSGQANVRLCIAKQQILPGDYLYSDWNAILIAESKLDIDL